MQMQCLKSLGLNHLFCTEWLLLKTRLSVIHLNDCRQQNGFADNGLKQSVYVVRNRREGCELYENPVFHPQCLRTFKEVFKKRTCKTLCKKIKQERSGQWWLLHGLGTISLEMMKTHTRMYDISGPISKNDAFSFLHQSLTFQVNGRLPRSPWEKPWEII